VFYVASSFVGTSSSFVVQDEPVEHLRMALAECQCHVAAHGVSNERTAPDTKGREGVGYRVGQEIHRMHFACDDRNAVPRQIQRHYAYLFIEVGDEILPYQ